MSADIGSVKRGKVFIDSGTAHLCDKAGFWLQSVKCTSQGVREIILRALGGLVSRRMMSYMPKTTCSSVPPRLFFVTALRAGLTEHSLLWHIMKCNEIVGPTAVLRWLHLCTHHFWHTLKEARST